MIIIIIIIGIIGAQAVWFAANKTKRGLPGASCTAVARNFQLFQPIGLMLAGLRRH
jgi:hypothetical protein